MPIVSFPAEDYWLAHPEAEVRVRASFHQGYGGPLPQLEAAIRALHAQVSIACCSGDSIHVPSPHALHFPNAYKRLLLFNQDPMLFCNDLPVAYKLGM